MGRSVARFRLLASGLIFLLVAHLDLIDPLVGAVLADKLLVCAALDDLPPLHDQHLIGALDGREPMRDHERGLPVHHVLERLLDTVFRLHVHAGRRIVQDQDARLDEDGAGQRHPLALTAGEHRATVADLSLVAVGEPRGEMMCLGACRSPLDGLLLGVRTTVGNVAAYALREEERVLRRDGHVLT